MLGATQCDMHVPGAAHSNELGPDLGDRDGHPSRGATKYEFQKRRELVILKYG